MSCPGWCFNFDTSAARSPLIKCELFHASFVKVLDATNFGMLLNRSASVRVFPVGPSRREPLVRHTSQEERVRGAELVDLELLGLVAPEWEAPLLGRFDDAVQRREQGGSQRARSRHRFSSVRATEDQYFSLRGGRAARS